MAQHPGLPESLKKLLNGEMVTVKHHDYDSVGLENAMENSETLKFFELDCYVFDYGWNITENCFDVDIKATKESINNFKIDL